MGSQPGLHLRCLVRAVIVQQQMQLLLPRKLTVQPQQEFQELLMAVSGLALPDHLAVQQT